VNRRVAHCRQDVQEGSVKNCCGKSRQVIIYFGGCWRNDCCRSRRLIERSRRNDTPCTVPPNGNLSDGAFALEQRRTCKRVRNCHGFVLALTLFMPPTTQKPTTADMS
jgi:hypothetical protein